MLGVRLVCRSEQESHIRSLLLYALGGTGLTLRSLHSEDTEPADRIEVRADLVSAGSRDRALEQAVARLSFEPSVSTVHWEVASDDDGADVTLSAVSTD